jgi:hypothetical protein
MPRDDRPRGPRSTVIDPHIYDAGERAARERARAARLRDQALRNQALDVARAQEGIRRAGVTYGPRSSRRGPRDVLVDTTRNFVRRYGWRAYAIPIMVFVTVVALISSESARHHSAAPRLAANGATGVNGKVAAAPSTPPMAPSHIALKDDAPGQNAQNTVPKGFALPPGASYTMRGDGTYRILKGTSPKVGHGTLYRYSIDVENGVTGVNLKQYENDVVTTLSDPRSWSGHGVSLERVDSGYINFHVTLTSALTVRKLCGYSIPVETSCYAPYGSVDGLDVNRVVFDVARWMRGSTAYAGDLATYREYMINHEDGHALGHEHAHECLPDGLAPTMMQQTFGLRSAATHKLCQANPWPYPTNAKGQVAKGAPGAEQPDTPQNDEYGLGD